MEAFVQQAEREAAGLEDEDEEGPAGSDEEGEHRCVWLPGWAALRHAGALESSLQPPVLANSLLC